MKVYNLEVEGLHTYYVTNDSIFVHNEYEVSNQEDLSLEFFNSLTDNGTVSGGGRSGDGVDLRGPVNSFVKTDSGHVVIYGKKGTKIMDISKKE